MIWENDGRRKVGGVNGVNIFYTLQERKLTSQWEKREKLQTTEEYKILKMPTECKRRGFAENEIAVRKQQIQQEMEKEWYYECEDWGTDEITETPNPHLKRNKPTSSDEQ